METFECSARRILLICGLVVISLLLSGAYAEKINTTDPTANVNLSPFMQSISAYYCLKNHSKACSTNYTLSDHGWLNVTADDTEEFCQTRGCADHTRDVLKCIHYVKPDYTFMNRATVHDISRTIFNGCNDNGFNGTTHIQTNDAVRSKITLFVSVALVLGVAFNQLA